MPRGRTKPVQIAPTYVVGLVDGEGCFSVRFNQSQRRRAKVDIGFSVKLRAVDRDVLVSLQRFFGCGGIYIQRDRRPRHSLCYRYEVTATDELNRVIVPFFLRYPFQTQTKREDFILFIQILELVRQKRHLTNEGVEIIRRLKQSMHQGSLDAGNPLVQPYRKVGPTLPTLER